MSRGRARLVAMVLVIGLGVLATGCGSTETPTGAGGAPTPKAAAAGGPSAVARMICAAEAQGEVAQGLGLTPTGPATAAWAAPVYSCTYAFPAGQLLLSVRDLSGAAETTAYFTAARTAGAATDLPGLGDAAFAAANGSVYVRKDFKVLHVDVSRLPDFLGQPPISRATAGVRVAEIIMSCWTGG
ncbi:MAG TPA: hypothetical protein VGJ63_23640 [Micromonosporaceae bacterium]|jgi:hypothetical protein